MKNLWNILGMIGERKRYLTLLVFRIPFDFLLNLSQVIFLGNGFRAIERGNQQELLSACIFYGLASILLFTYNSIIWRLFSVMYIQIAGKLRIVAADSIVHHSLSEIESGSGGDFMTKLNLDTGMTIMILGGALNIPHFTIAIFNIIATSMVLVVTDTRAFFIVMGFVIPHILLNSFLVARPMTSLQSQVQKNRGRMNTVLTAMISMADTAELYDAKDMLMNNFRRESKNIMHLKMIMILRNSLGSFLIPLFGSLGYLALLIYAGNGISNGTMLFGDLTAVSKLQSGILMGVFMGVRSSIHIRMNVAGLHRVNELLKHQAGRTE